MRIISIILLLSFPMLINAQPDRIYKLNRGTKIQVRTGNELAGNSLLKGDILLFEVTNDVYAHGEKVISRNAKVYGTVIELEEKKSSKKIRFDFSIDSLFMDDGRKVDLNLAYEIDSKVTKGSFRGKPSLIESGTIFNAIVQNDLIVKYGYSSQKINEILNSFENSNINKNYENLYSVNDEIKKFSNTTYKVSSEKIRGYIGDKKYQIDGDSEFSLVAEFIKYLNSNNQSERDESFTRIFDYMYGISSQEMQFKDKFEYTYIE